MRLPRLGATMTAGLVSVALTSALLTSASAASPDVMPASTQLEPFKQGIIIWVDVKSLDFSEGCPVMELNPRNPAMVGDVSRAFEPVKPAN